MPPQSLARVAGDFITLEPGELYWIVVTTNAAETGNFRLKIDNTLLDVGVPGSLGVGTVTPQNPFRMVRSDGKARLVIEEKAGPPTARQLFRRTAPSSLRPTWRRSSIPSGRGIPGSKVCRSRWRVMRTTITGGLAGYTELAEMG